MVWTVSRLFLCTSLILLGVACSDSQAGSEPEAAPPVPAPAIIERPGDYSINAGTGVISIDQVPAGALGYRIGSLSEPDRMGVGLIGNPAKPWFFHNAADGSVWSYIETDGVIHWTHSESARWESRVFDDSVADLPDNMPFVFYERLPKEEKSRWVPMPES